MRRILVVAAVAAAVCGCGPINDTGGGGDTNTVGFTRGIAFVRGGDVWIADQSDFENQSQRLTTDQNNSQPALSRDGRRVAYVHNDPNAGSAGLFTVPTSGGSPSALVQMGSRSYTGMAWSPDGNTLYFAADHALFRISADGSGETQVSPAAGDFHQPSVSSDGTLYALDLEAQAEVRVTGGAATPVFNVPDAVRAVISPSGASLAYEDGTAHDIFVIDAAGSNARQVTAVSGAQQREPSWSTDGANLFFTSNAGGSDKIYEVAASASSSSGTLVQVGSQPSYGG